MYRLSLLVTVWISAVVFVEPVACGNGNSRVVLGNCQTLYRKAAETLLQSTTIDEKSELAARILSKSKNDVVTLDGFMTVGPRHVVYKYELKKDPTTYVQGRYKAKVWLANPLPRNLYPNGNVGSAEGPDPVRAVERSFHRFIETF